MLASKDPAVALHGMAEMSLGLGESAQGEEQEPQAMARGVRAPVLVTEHPTPELERLALRLQRALDQPQLAQGRGRGLQQPRLDEGLTAEHRLDRGQRAFEHVPIERLQRDVDEVDAGQCPLQLRERRLHRWLLGASGSQERPPLLHEDPAEPDTHQGDVDLAELLGLEGGDLLAPARPRRRRPCRPGRGLAGAGRRRCARVSNLRQELARGTPPLWRRSPLGGAR